MIECGEIFCPRPGERWILHWRGPARAAGRITRCKTAADIRAAGTACRALLSIEGGELLGFVEGSPETWNNRFRISNICVFDPARRQGSVGTALMQAIERAEEASGARMIVLETQTCNENAIAFYRRNGFALIGLDLYAYSNTDPERREVRLEMGKKLK